MATPARSAHPPAVPANFDGLARAYRWLEYLTFARALQRCRTRLLRHTALSREALVLGDGDGRFLATLLRQNPALHATAVDASAAMLRELCRRCAAHRHQLHGIHADALTYVRSAAAPQPDLVVTHFFLDCLQQAECNQLAEALTVRTTPGALWLLSEFRVPPGPRGIAARLLLRTLYTAFALLTGLAVRRLPDHAAALTRAGWTRTHCEPSLGGLLTAELWQRQ